MAFFDFSNELPITFNSVPFNIFYQWRDLYVYRNRAFKLNYGNNSVDLSNETQVYEFSAERILSIINGKVGDFLCVHFGCKSGNENFKEISVFINTMQSCNCTATSDFITPVNYNFFTSPRDSKVYYFQRLERIYELEDNSFNNDEEAVSYEISDQMVSFFEKYKGGNVKIVLVKIPDNERTRLYDNVMLPGNRKGRLGVVFTPPEFNPLQTLSDSELNDMYGQMELKDFNTECCPPRRR